MNLEFISRKLYTAIHPTDFCEMLIGGRKVVYTNSFFEVNNIMKNLQNESSEFNGLLYVMLSKKPFINQDISYINGKGEMKFSTVSDYIKEFCIII